MLSTLTTSRHDVGSRNHSSFLNGRDPVADAQLSVENRLCPGCKQSAVNENGGLVVAFGQSFFHVDCFKCAKCGDQVTADTNLLLLSDGSPICANCSYSCNVCHMPILDEAIMTGDDSYHAHCFKCKVCKNRIDELVFAKTSQGIYCMNCHSERMAKIRRHAQKKAERAEKERALAGGSGHPKSQDAPSAPVPVSRPPAPHVPEAYPQINTSQGQSNHSPNIVRSAPPRGQIPYGGDSFATTPSQPASPVSPRRPNHGASLAVDTIPPPSVSPPRSPTTVTSPSRVNSLPQTSGTPRMPPSPVDAKNGLLLPVKTESDGMQRRKSFDDGVRPLNLLLPQASGALEGFDSLSDRLSSTGSLNIPTSRMNKRRSINPAMTFDLDTSIPATAAPSITPPSPSSYGRSHTLGRDSPRVRSPLATQFPEVLVPRTSPDTDSRQNSPSSVLRFPISAAESERWLNEGSVTARTRTESASTYLAENSQKPKVSPQRMPTLDSVPPRSTSLAVVLDGSGGAPPPSWPSEEASGVTPAARATSRAGSASSGSTVGLRQRSADGRLSPAMGDHRLSSQPSDAVRNLQQQTSRSRPASPARRADVPRGVESGTDTEAESESGRKSPYPELQGPVPVAKNETSALEGSPPESQVIVRENGRSTTKGGSAENSDMEDISPAEERMSHATFIAPALPPIRFSMNAADFSELLGDADADIAKGAPDQLANVAEDSEGSSPGSGPPSAVPLAEGTTFGMLAPNEPSSPDEDKHLVSGFGGITASPPQSKASSQDGHHGHSSNSSVVLPRDNHTLPKRSNTISSRLPQKHDSSSLHSRRNPELGAGRGRASSDSSQMDTSSQQSHGSANAASSTTRTTVNEPNTMAGRQLGSDSFEYVRRRLQEALVDANECGAQQLAVEKGFIEAILAIIERRNAEFSKLRGEFDGMKRASKQYIDGLSVAQTEYDRELKARRDAEAEVTRLRVLLSGQAARLTAISGENTRQAQRQQMSQDLSDNLDRLQQDLAKLKVERDMALAELEELTTSKSSTRANAGEIPAVQLGRSLTMRLDNIKLQYHNELLPMTQQREALFREVAELKSVRDVFLEETTALNARNEELAKLSAMYARRIDAAGSEPARQSVSPTPKQSNSFDKARPQPHPLAAMLYAPSGSSSTISEDPNEARYAKSHKESDITNLKPKFMKWPGSKTKEAVAKDVVLSSTSSVTSTDTARSKPFLEHAFQHLSVLRFTRCDHCGDKMWGSQLRCSNCSMSVHTRCINHVYMLCSQHNGARRDENVPLPPSMFGRDLTEQVRADAQGGDRMVPVIVEKCIEAVEASAMAYEGIYRKTGGSGQSKAITQLFERGDYAAFDLRDTDRFTDICSVTSVLKTYFRSLPVPLLTYDLHENFIAAAQLKEPAAKSKALSDLVKKLPSEHYYTLRMLMLHLNRVRERSEKNLMNARNLGVVFGPTLMRSPDPAGEFSDMAGKALSIEWLVENAPTLFSPSIPPN